MGLPRYAVYWTPEVDHPLWRAGCAWLGRDPAAALPDGSSASAAPALRAPLAAPALYGFHATLKPPMALAEDADETDFLAAVHALARRHAPFLMPRLQLAWLGRFLALRNAETVDDRHALRRLADACVRDLDAFRRPPSAQELARRRGVGLDAEQDALLQRWGYPHVLNRWRFHMSLSDSLPDPSTAPAQALAHQALAHFQAALVQPLECRSLCVFRQAGAGLPFRLTHRLALGADA